MEIEKFCNKCKEVKKLSQFSLKRCAKDGHSPQCKFCNKLYSDSIKERRAVYLSENKDKIAARQKVYDDAHRDKKNAYKKLHKDRLSRLNVELERYKLRTDPHFRMIKNLRGLTKISILRGYGKKSIKTIELLGADWITVKAHIEAQFHPGMTWENHGEWHFDHIRPIASFDMGCIEQQRIACNYKNLQPLWALDNLKKSDKWEESSAS